MYSTLSPRDRRRIAVRQGACRQGPQEGLLHEILDGHPGAHRRAGEVGHQQAQAIRLGHQPIAIVQHFVECSRAGTTNGSLHLETPLRSNGASSGCQEQKNSVAARLPRTTLAVVPGTAIATTVPIVTATGASRTPGTTVRSLGRAFACRAEAARRTVIPGRTVVA